MKKYLGQIIFNIVAAAAGAVMFTSTGILDSAATAVLGIVGLMASLCVGNYFFVKLANEGKQAFQPDYIITEQTFDSLNEPESYLEVMKDLRNYSPCRAEAIKMVQQWELFRKKSATLNAISYQGGVYEVVNQDVESVMLNNMVLFMKRAAIMQSSSNNELNEHSDLRDTAVLEAMLAPIAAGEPVGVISDAGCPAVADPGADLVAIAQRKGYKVFPLVGPSSILMSLMASGFNGQRFAFEGYLPVDAQARQARLKEMTRRIEREQQTQIFIEAPYRNNQLIADLVQHLPPRLRLCVASDITGEKESIITRTLGEWRQAQYDYHKVPTIFLLYQ